jgi:hypothetical protein
MIAYRHCDEKRNRGAHLTNAEKRRLIDLRRYHLIDQACIQESFPPNKKWAVLRHGIS